jgi:membrane protease YdiL (CAAX protease family)
VIYAIAAGFMFTVIFYKTKSLWACIIAHGCLNALSAFANEAVQTPLMEVGSAAVLTVVAAAYGWYIWKKVE